MTVLLVDGVGQPRKPSGYVLWGGEKLEQRDSSIIISYMAKKLNFEVKEKVVSLAGTCFWYWGGFYSFLESCGVPKSIQSRYPRAAYNKYTMMRGVLEELERTGNHEIINAIVSGFYRLKTTVDKDNPNEAKAKTLLAEFRELIGNDPIEKELQRIKQEEAKATYRQGVATRDAQLKQLNEMNEEFLRLTALKDLTPQQRGYKLESLFFDLLHFNEIEHSKPYRTANGEQIDGHFQYEKFDYLVEAKWTSGLTKQEDLSIFDGKIRGKAQSTRGFFVSAEGFDENAIAKFSGDAPRIVLMTGEDLALILNGSIRLEDALKGKIDAIVRYGKILFPIRNIMG